MLWWTLSMDYKNTIMCAFMTNHFLLPKPSVPFCDNQWQNLITNMRLETPSHQYILTKSNDTMGIERFKKWGCVAINC